MNITFLIGNGFDLGLGLETQYKQFYKEYTRTKSESGNILKFKTEIAQNIEQWSDFEVALGKHCNGKQKEEVLSQFENFVEAFIKYLTIQEARIVDINQEEIAETFLKAMKTFYNVRTADKEAIETLFANNAHTQHKYKFISFNYTKCVDLFVASYSKIVKEKQLSHTYQGTTKVSSVDKNVIHVHGYTQENMIMGVNDISQIDNEEFRKDEEIVEEIVKPRANINAKMNYDVMATNAIKESQLICIYGMSIGETDKKWWELIINWLHESANRRLLILKHDRDVEKGVLHKYSRAERDLVKKFLAFSTLNDGAKQILKKRIHVEFNHDVFSLKLVKDEPQKTIKKEETITITKKRTYKEKRVTA